MFPFENSPLKYSQRLWLAIKANSGGVYCALLFTILSMYSLKVNELGILIISIITVVLFIVPYFNVAKTYILSITLTGDETTILYQHFIKTKSITINKNDIKVELEISGRGPWFVPKMIMLHKRKAENFLIQPVLGKWSLQDIQKLKEDFT